MIKKNRFAIIGCGKIALRHAEQASQQGHLIAVCDIVKEKADLLAKQFSAKPYYDIKELLANENEVEIVSICTPNGLHALHSIMSLESGKHVLCEKPMAISSVDGKKMIEAAGKYSKKLFIVKQNRFNPPVAFVKQLLQKNKLGKILSFQLNCFWNRPNEYFIDNWRGTMQFDGGTLFTQFSHFIDLLYWFLGDVSEINGLRNNAMHKVRIEFEDTGVAFLKMANGAIGTLNYTINAFKKNMEGSFTLFGKKGTVKIGGQYLNELEYFSVENELMPDLPKSNTANQYGLYEGSMSNHDKVYETLIRAISDPAISFITNEEAVKTIEIIERIYKASPML